MCNCFGNDNCSWVILLIIILMCCGGGNASREGNGCGNSCGCC
ncbi:MAG: hypothetical protein SOZ77_05525 [Candidatus Limousia pullorum]|nr:hypothetical protein [Candidatus Limousia pullorum]